jgi:hypothetical protein
MQANINDNVITVDADSTDEEYEESGKSDNDSSMDGNLKKL